MSAREAEHKIFKMMEQMPVPQIAAQLAPHTDSTAIDSHVYNVKTRGVSPTLYRAMVAAGWIEHVVEPVEVLPCEECGEVHVQRKACEKTRYQCRLAASVNREERAALKRMAKAMGHESWTAYCRWEAQRQLRLEGFLDSVGLKEVMYDEDNGGQDVGSTG